MLLAIMFLPQPHTIVFHAIFLPFKSYNVSSTPQIPHLILTHWMLPFPGVNAQCSSLIPHVLCQESPFLSHCFNYHQFTGACQLLICNVVWGFSTELQNHSFLDVSTLSLQSHLKCIPFTLFSLLGSLSFEDFALQWAFRHQCWRQPRLLPLSHLSIILPINYHALQNTLCIVLFKFIHLSLMFLLFHLLKLPSPPKFLFAGMVGSPKSASF